MKIKMLLILLFICPSIYCQTNRNVERVIEIKKEHSFYMNSKTRIGGKSRNTVKIDLPENTIQWFYTYTTTLNVADPNETKKNIELGAQLTNLIANNILGGGTLSLTSNLINQIVKPTGASIIDVYLTNLDGYNSFNQKDLLGLWVNYKPASYAEGSRENALDGVVQIDDVTNGTVYLCFKNPSATEGIMVTLEVSAIVLEEEYVDEWNTTNKNKFTNKCLESFYNNDSQAREVCNCYANKMTSELLPSSYFALTNSEKLSRQRETLNKCYKETGNESLQDVNKQIEKLIEEINGLEQLKDYSNIILKYEEIERLGIKSDNLYNSLGWYSLLSQQFEKAKQYLTKGLGKNPNNLYLQGNLAHYFLLTGQYYNAEEIYLKYKKSKFSKKIKWKDAVRDDFELFERTGLHIPEMNQIRKLLKIKIKKK